MLIPADVSIFIDCEKKYRLNKGIIPNEVESMSMGMKGALIETGKSLTEALLIVGVIIVMAYALTGTWHVGYAVESGSMAPNMQIGDLIFVQSPHRTHIITYEEGMQLNYKSFNNYGDVIIYRPDGFSSVTPIIHRAM